MQQQSPYRKSNKGSHAIAQRDHSLPPRLRSLLILVDGKRSDDELAKIGAAFGDTAQLLSQLAESGHIERVPSASAIAADAPAREAAETEHSASPPLAPISLAQAQRLAVKRLTDTLGPLAEGLCLRVESTRNSQDFIAAVKKAEASLRGVRGDAAADAFAREMAAQRIS